MDVIDENQEQQEQDESGLSRRDILKRGAIGGGAMWAAPVVQKVRLSQSVAQGTSPIEPTPTPTEVPCQTTGPVQMAHAVIDGPEPMWQTHGDINCRCENEHISVGSVYFDAEAIGFHSFKLTIKAELDCTIVAAQSEYFDQAQELANTIGLNCIPCRGENASFIVGSEHLEFEPAAAVVEIPPESGDHPGQDG